MCLKQEMEPSESFMSITNMLDTKLRCMCSLAGIEGDFTNHSLRATSATQMFDMGVPEKVIQER